MRNFLIVIALVLMFRTESLAQGCTLDQSLLTWNGGTSERNLPGYYEWQSFTAAKSGALCEIDLMFGNSNIKLNGTGTLKLYSGTGSGGTLLRTQNVSVNGTNYGINTNFWQVWSITNPPSIISGQIYTFQFIPTINGGLPDPYIIVVNTNNLYAGGRNSQSPTFDNPFKVYVRSSMPLRLLNFTAVPTGDKVLLTWTTSTEVNTAGFDIQKSTDGLRFFSIGKVYAAGNSTALLTYVFADDALRSSKLYYRLKMIDQDAHYEYSKVVPVTDSRLTVTLYTNAAQDELWISGNDLRSVRIFSSEGRLLVQQSLSAGLNTISLRSLATGVNVVMVMDDNGTTWIRRIAIRH